jgi:hypothetical protein
MRPSFGFAALAALLLTPLTALSGQPAPSAAPQARSPLLPTTALTTRSGISEMKLSPDGNRIALKAVGRDGKARLALVDANTKQVISNLEISAKQEPERPRRPSSPVPAATLMTSGSMTATGWKR